METLTKRVTVTNMSSPRGGDVPNQFVIRTPEGCYFQSYKSVIAFEPYNPIDGVRVILDAKYWDYSTTTGKYRNQFLGEKKADTMRKINLGEYVLADLNA